MCMRGHGGRWQAGLKESAGWVASYTDGHVLSKVNVGGGMLHVEPMLILGGVDAPNVEVEGFYNFWYNFDSWPSFKYLEKEVNE